MGKGAAGAHVHVHGLSKGQGALPPGRCCGRCRRILPLPHNSQAAGVIHTDFEKGFIRAETVAYKDFVAVGGLAAAKEKGLTRLEGKDYVVKEGDIMLFRFNV